MLHSVLESAERADRSVRVTLEHVECNAACDYAPVMMVNWEFMDNMTPESAVSLVDDLRAQYEKLMEEATIADRERLTAYGARGAGRAPSRPSSA